MSLEAAELLNQVNAAMSAGSFDALLDAAPDGEADEVDEKQPPQDQTQKADTGTEGKTPPDGEVEPNYPEGAPIASKSGTYTIPHEQLTKARDRAATHARERDEAIADRDRFAAELAAMKQQQGNQGSQTHEQNMQKAADAIESGDVDLDLFGDWSEEAVAKGVAELNRRAVTQAEQRMQAKLDEALAPLKQQQRSEAEQAFYSPIYAKHPDADEFTQSKEFADWKAALPSYERKGVDSVMAEGSQQEIIEVFDKFKVAHGGQAAKPTGVKLPEAKDHIPASLSEIVGTSQHQDEVERVLSLSGPALQQAMERMTPEQRDRVLDRL